MKKETFLKNLHQIFLLQFEEFGDKETLMFAYMERYNVRFLPSAEVDAYYKETRGTDCNIDLFSDTQEWFADRANNETYDRFVQFDLLCRACMDLSDIGTLEQRVRKADAEWDRMAEKFNRPEYATFKAA